MGEARGIGIGNDVGDDDGRAAGQCLAHEARIGHRDRGVGRHHPEELDPPVCYPPEHIDGFEARASAQRVGVPESGDIGAFGIGKAEVAGEHVGQPADLAPAHGVGLAGDAERAGSDPVDPASGEVEVDDRIALVGAADRLVGALAEQGDHARMGGDQIGELGESGGGNAANLPSRLREGSGVGLLVDV